MKKFIIALMAFCLVFSLAGCGGGGGGGGSSVDQNIVIYNGLKESETFTTDVNGSSMKESMNIITDGFKDSNLTGKQKRDILANYICDDFKNTTNSDSSKNHLLDVMESRLDRYIVNDWGFKVTDFNPKGDANSTEITTICSIRLDLVLKEGKTGKLPSWNSATLNKQIIWKKENDVWKIKSGFPYVRETDF